MKKFLLAGFVILSFVVYSLHQRGDGGSAVVKAPAAATTNPATPATQQSSTASPAAVAYKDGQYTGTKADAFYGLVQVLAVINGGKLTEVRFLQYPSDRSTSVQINSQAIPYLQQEALKAQSANVNIITGATDTSQAFIQSLTAALASARA
jgi:uncharacterized protein with FMN-binding domain